MGIGEESNNGDVELNKPVAVQVRQDSQGLVFMPYLQLTDALSCVFKSQHIRHVFTNPKEALKENYRQQFGSGIQLPIQPNILS